MSTRGVVQAVAPIIVLAFCSATVSAGTYRLTVAGERLEFVTQVERGYVVKLTPDVGGIRALAGMSALDAEDAAPIGGLDRRGVWVVENRSSAERNEEMIRSLRAGSRVGYAAPLFSSNGETVAIIPEVVVRVRPGIEMEEVKRLGKAAGCTIRKRMEFTEQEYLLEVLGPDAESVFAAVEQLGQAPEVEWACPNTAMRLKLPTPVLPADRPALPAASAAAGTVRIASAGEEAERTGVFPNDEYFPNQWHLYNTGQSGGTPGADIRAPEAWEITTGDPNIVIAVPDTGVDGRHPDLVDNLVPGYDFYENDDQPDPALDQPGNTHGTGCAGLVAAKGDNALGVTGVTWDCRIMPIRVESVGGLCSDADIATAFRWMANHGADVVTNSWGYGLAVPITHSAIIDVTKSGGLGRGGRGCVVVGASGNDGTNNVIYIASYPEVIGVGGADHNDVRCSYSNYGSQLDLVAPTGVGLTWDDVTRTKGLGWLWTTDIVGPAGWTPHPRNPFSDSPDYFGVMAGTSGACPIAAGVAALILSIEPNLTGDEVRHFLERSAKDLGDPGRDDYYGWGRVDAKAALDMVLAYRCDLNSDWQVDEQDLAILDAAIDVNDLSADIAPAKKRDGVVDADDLELLTRYLGTVIPEMGLIAHWQMDEVEGETAQEVINYHDGTLHGGAIWQPSGGVLGGALQFDGVDDYVSAKYVFNPSAGSFSVLVWVKGGASRQVVLSQAGGASWLAMMPVTGYLMSGLKAPSGGKELYTQVVVTDGDWHRIGLVRDGKNRILYVDAVEVGRDTQASLAGSTGNITIGAGSTLAPGTFWSGLIDEVRIYDRAVKP
jgi:subtilisin family serine protease